MVRMLYDNEGRPIGYYDAASGRATIQDLDYVREKFCHMEPSFTMPVIMERTQEWECSKCGEYTVIQVLEEEERPKFCSNCGCRAEY